MLQPRVLERIEGLAVAVAAIYLYWHGEYDWTLFAVLILAPDLSMFGYLAGTRAGAAFYNLFHVYVWGLSLIAAGVVSDNESMVSAGLIWVAHIGLDRLLGFGLKYPTAFKDTHLQRL